MALFATDEPLNWEASDVTRFMLAGLLPNVDWLSNVSASPPPPPTMVIFLWVLPPLLLLLSVVVVVAPVLVDPSVAGPKLGVPLSLRK